VLGANPDYSVFQYGISSSPLHTEYNVISCMQPIWGISSAGRAVALQAIGQRFDPVILHHSIQDDYFSGRRVPLQGTGREFESLIVHHAVQFRRTRARCMGVTVNHWLVEFDPLMRSQVTGDCNDIF
jgi:hypothetical protein